MKRFLLCLIGILLVTVESSITNYIDIYGVSFSLVLVYCTIISLYLDELEAGIIGAIIGLTKDITVGGVFGVNALILFAVCYGISTLREKIYKESYITIGTLVLITSIFDSMVNITATTLVYNSYGILTMVLKGIVIIPIINSILSLIIYKLFKKNILKLKEE
ncbi:rod shape-determining protein MreD [Romboutsia ilealis]|uniref:Rod shape-determining protein MreD n=1 Tax=Romboutsia faecis TaxID=2764597 RepID=A0ABR7JL94_9FIRM|nr:rod shape-determining protein MreD [Romboutsia faecis]MBC5995684.1 rod shape-determining protein MreD [Romboutsia faecis]MRN23886.1 rod shape-determining protein MreD [Romboutsia ilealis]